MVEPTMPKAVPKKPLALSPITTSSVVKAREIRRPARSRRELEDAKDWPKKIDDVNDAVASSS